MKLSAKQHGLGRAGKPLSGVPGLERGVVRFRRGAGEIRKIRTSSIATVAVRTNLEASRDTLSDAIVLNDIEFLTTFGLRFVMLQRPYQGS